MRISEPIDLMYFRPISVLCEKIYPRNHAKGVVPVVKFFVCLALEQNPIKITDSFFNVILHFKVADKVFQLACQLAQLPCCFNNVCRVFKNLAGRLIDLGNILGYLPGNG